MPEPRRLTEANDLDPQLRSALDGLRVESFSGYDTTSGAARLAEAMAKPPAPGTGSATWVWVTAAVVGVSIIVWSAVRLSDSREPRGDDIVSVAESTEAIPDEPPGPLQPPRATTPLPATSATADPPAVDPGLPTAPIPRGVPASQHNDKPNHPAAEPTPPPAAGPGNDVAAEIAAMKRIKTTLENDPKGALAQIRSARKRFKPGMFSEERDYLELVALHGLGRTEALTKGARGFLNDHPKSTYASRVRTWLSD